mmetsp:Transcript_13949/g.39998  ORF Transcript_13949/g.39998 Transcript_13949/m.39998 type:complete len:275 (-) Transcript_13949:1019-1843(-)
MALRASPRAPASPRCCRPSRSAARGARPSSLVVAVVVRRRRRSTRARGRRRPTPSAARASPLRHHRPTAQAFWATPARRRGASPVFVEAARPRRRTSCLSPATLPTARPAPRGALPAPRGAAPPPITRHHQHPRGRRGPPMYWRWTPRAPVTGRRGAALFQHVRGRPPRAPRRRAPSAAVAPASGPSFANRARRANPATAAASPAPCLVRTAPLAVASTTPVLAPKSASGPAAAARRWNGRAPRVSMTCPQAVPRPRRASPGATRFEPHTPPSL